MTIQEKQTEIIADFAIFDDWMEKYEYIIDLGKDLPLIDPAKKTADRLIEGCQSQVWLDAAVVGDRIRFTADSDAIITKGIIGLLIRVFDNEKPEDITKSDLHFIQEIGLQEHLSPTRSNGLVSMINKIKLLALSALA
ncbi:MAG: SufE family protein [Fluviicola sp.]|nr:SufE family protein [Fluviicola sp.]MBP6272282.1 SufE family protein [Fluviicola sp.]